MKYDTLYKRTSKGDTQVWWMEREGDKYRTHSGKEGGAIVISAWTTAKPKNTGKANATNGEQQAILEVEAKYVKKQKSGQYFLNKDDIDEKRFFIPMLAKMYERKRVTTFPVFIQPKLNGIRCIAKKDGLFTRTGEPIVNCPHIFDELKPIFDKKPNIVFDGELYNHDYAEDLPSLASAIRKQTIDANTVQTAKDIIQYHVYDCNFEGVNIIANFSDRSKYLTRFINKLEYCFALKTFTAHSHDEIDALFKKFLGWNYEGLMVRLDAPYEAKRSFNLLKHKPDFDAEYELVDVHEGKGNWAGYGKAVTLKNTDGSTFSAGVKGNRAFCKDLLEKKNEYIGKPATIRYQEMTPYGVPFHGRLIIIRDYE